MDALPTPSTSRPAPSPDPRSVAPDLFGMGRAAVANRRVRHGDRGIFGRSRQLLADGSWRGPRDAAITFVEDRDLEALGGISKVASQGARVVVASGITDVIKLAAEQGLRTILRLPFAAGEPTSERDARVAAVVRARAAGLPLDGVLPTPDGEPQGLDTLAFFARCRLEIDVPHLLADFAALGHRLAQMALGFGADELWGPIVPERSLRLGANAGNPQMTRKEAALLLRGAGLAPHERLAAGFEEVLP